MGQSHLIMVLPCIFAGSALAFPAYASTLPLPPATYFGEAEVECTPCNPDSFYGSRTTPGHEHSDIYNTNTGIHYMDNDVKLSAAPYIRATTQADTTQDTGVTFTGSAYGNIQYDVEILGPSIESVPVNVFSKGFVKSTGFGQASASVSVTGTGVDISRSITTKSGQADQYISLDSEFQFETNTLYTVDISASASSSGYLYAPGKGFSEGYIDPVFTIDPAYASAYSLVFSSGIENQVSAVPLPASVLLLGTGLFVLGAIGCGSKRRGLLVA